MVYDCFYDVVNDCAGLAVGVIGEDGEEGVTVVRGADA